MRRGSTAIGGHRAAALHDSRDLRGSIGSWVTHCVCRQRTEGQKPNAAPRSPSLRHRLARGGP